MILFEKEFFDFKTAEVVDKDVVDYHKTGMSFYDDFLSKDANTIEYLKTNKNLTGEVVMMTPEEYYKACSEYAFDNRTSVEQLKRTRRADTKTLNHLKDVLTEYKHKFPMPMLNKAEHGQEGLHRMMVIGDLFGWDHKVPVLVVDWADKQRAFEEQKQKRLNHIQSNIRTAVQHALRYKFKDLEELREQIQWELDKQFDYDNDIQTPVQFELTTDEQYQSFTVSIGTASCDFDYEEIQFKDDSDLDDLDIDDLDIDETEDFLIRYFGDNWRETHPHLKNTFNIKESLTESDIEQMDTIIQNYWSSEDPGDGCIFIAPNGKFINIYPKLDDHEDLCYWLEELEDYDFDTPEDAQWFVSDFNYVRCRNSLHMCFINVPEKMTTAQYSSLERWLEEKVSSDRLDIEAWSGEWKTYNLDDYFPEDIIRIIKRSYSSGHLYEEHV